MPNINLHKWYVCTFMYSSVLALYKCDLFARVCGLLLVYILLT